MIKQNKIKQKKSSSIFNFFQDTGIYFFIALILILIIIVIVQMVIGTKISPSIEADSFILNILYSPSGLSHVDNSTGKLIPVIDINKLRKTGKNDGESYLDKQFKYGSFNSYISSRIRLYNKDKTFLLREDYFNKLSQVGQYAYGYDVWIQTDQNNKFKGAASTVYIYEFPVSYIENNKIEKGMLEILVVLPYD